MSKYIIIFISSINLIAYQSIVRQFFYSNAAISTTVLNPIKYEFFTKYSAILYPSYATSEIFNNNFTYTNLLHA
jgi:hypothetical protein